MWNINPFRCAHHCHIEIVNNYPFNVIESNPALSNVLREESRLIAFEKGGDQSSTFTNQLRFCIAAVQYLTCARETLFSSRILRPLRLFVANTCASSSFTTRSKRRKTVSAVSFDRWAICIICVGKQSEQQCKIKARQDEPPVCLAARWSRSSRCNFTRFCCSRCAGYRALVPLLLCHGS